MHKVPRISNNLRTSIIVLQYSKGRTFIIYRLDQCRCYVYDQLRVLQPTPLVREQLQTHQTLRLRYSPCLARTYSRKVSSERSTNNIPSPGQNMWRKISR